MYVFRKHYFKLSEVLFDDGTPGVPKHVGGDFVHLLCLYFSACKVEFMS
jgi:hypothetical protein